MAVNMGKVTASSDGTFAALKSRLAQGRGKMNVAPAKSFKNNTDWSKGAKRVGKGTFAVSGATPGTKKPGI